MAGRDEQEMIARLCSITCCFVLADDARPAVGRCRASPDQVEGEV